MNVSSIKPSGAPDPDDRSLVGWIRENPRYFFFLPLVLAVLAPLYFENPYKTKDTVIVAWGMVMRGESRPGYIACRDLFEKRHPGVRVQMFSCGRGDNPQRLMGAIAGNSAPDLVQFESYQVASWAARNAFVPLDEWIERDRDETYGVRREEYVKSSWEPVTWRGQTYGIPSWMGTFAMVYNKTAFREVGLDPESPPKTYDDLLEASKKLVKFDSAGNIERGGWIPLYFIDQKHFTSYLVSLLQAGGKLMSPDGLYPQIDTEEAHRVIDLYRKAHAIHGGWTKIQTLYSLIGGQSGDLFLSGRVAIDLEDDWLVYRVASFVPDFDFGVAPFPSFDGKTIVSQSIGLSYVIPINAPHPELAWEFIKWMNSPEAILLRNSRWREESRKQLGPNAPQYVGLHSNMACNEVAWAEPQFDSPRLQEAANVFRSLLPYTREMATNPVTAALRYRLGNALRRIFAGQMEVGEALRQVERELNKQLEEFRAEPPGLPLSGWAIAQVTMGILLCVVAATVILVVRQSRRGRIQWRNALGGYLLASPWLTGFFVFIGGPIIASFILSFCSYDVLHNPRFIGANNYAEAFTRDALFWKSLGNTAFMMLGIPIAMSVSLGIAMLLNMRVRGLGIYRTMYYLPAIVPMVAGAVLWQWLLSPQTGPVTWVFEHTLTPFFAAFGMELHAPVWLQDDAWIKPSFILMGLWNAGAGMIIWLAGLQGIPEQLYESAAIDGAGPWSRFWSITIPMLTPYIFFELITGIIGTFQIFTTALVITNDYPPDAVLFYVYHLFNNAFRYFHMGYASAMAWILFLIVLVLTVCQVWGAKRWVYYGGN
ncbi:MAG TPA: extracellular solute-binding protein [bacterium]|nr:extracellular solute-binding protein [bacterium]